MFNNNLKFNFKHKKKLNFKVFDMLKNEVNRSLINNANLRQDTYRKNYHARS